MKKLLTFLAMGAVVTFVLFFCGAPVHCAIPHMINYQGMLTESDGTSPVEDGTYNLGFKIYGSESGTDSLWWEYHSNVQVTHGLFNVILGSVSSLDLPFDTDYWLEIKVGAQTMPDRLRFTSVGYAYRAEKADTADYALSSPSGPGDYTWTFRITDTADTTISTGGNWGISRYGNTLYGNADSTHVNLGVACTTGASGQNYKYCTVGGGRKNTASERYATVGGGTYNTASGYGATAGGGYLNTASSHYATVGGGYSDTASGFYATVGGGSYNTATAYYATVGGGYDNTAGGAYSFAAGRRARANHTGAFVWADATDADFTSTGSDQFLIRASGGVGIGTNSPEAMLHVQDATEGVIKVGTPTGNGNATVIFEEGNADALALRYDGSANELRIDDETTGNTRMVIERSGKVGIGTETPGTKLAVLGLTGTSSYNYLKVNTTTGAFYYSSSSKRYKEDVRPLADDFHKIFQAEPKSFIDKASGEREIGYIAEEFDGLGLNNLVIYDKEGRPDGLKYELVSLYLLEVMKDQAEMMKELEADNENLRRRIEALEAR